MKRYSTPYTIDLSIALTQAPNFYFRTLSWIFVEIIWMCSNGSGCIITGYIPYNELITMHRSLSSMMEKALL